MLSILVYLALERISSSGWIRSDQVSCCPWFLFLSWDLDAVFVIEVDFALICRCGDLFNACILGHFVSGCNTSLSELLEWDCCIASWEFCLAKTVLRFYDLHLLQDMLLVLRRYEMLCHWSWWRPIINLPACIVGCRKHFEQAMRLLLLVLLSTDLQVRYLSSYSTTRAAAFLDYLRLNLLLWVTCIYISWYLIRSWIALGQNHWVLRVLEKCVALRIVPRLNLGCLFLFLNRRIAVIYWIVVGTCCLCCLSFNACTSSWALIGYSDIPCPVFLSRWFC
jgi:hypothetical protein